VRNIHIIDCHSGVFTGGTEFVSDGRLPAACCLLLPVCCFTLFFTVPCAAAWAVM